jgi:hypothetical protein
MSMFIETLEARELLSASPLHTRAGAAVIAADEAAIVAARNAIPTDRLIWNAKLKDDRASIPAVRLMDVATLRADKAKLRADRGNAILVQADQGQILIDQARLKDDVTAASSQLKIDQGSAKQVLAADRKALNEAIVKLKIDRVLK